MAPKAPPKVAPKKGPPAAMLAKIKAALDAQKAEELRLQQEEEAAEKKRIEEERIAEIERKREEEEKKAHRDAEKEAMREHGRDKKRLDKEVALERMRAAGMLVPDMIKKGEAPPPLPKTVTDPKPKPKKPEPKHVDPTPVAAPVVDEIPDDWETLLDEPEPAPAPVTAAPPAPTAEVAAAAAAATTAAAGGKGELELVSNLRSPILCVLGHVDAGKTSLLDRIRRTNVQGGEAGGITQQIGATFMPREAIVAKTAVLNAKYQHDLKVPGLLVIDTPGHESFTNLRSRGSSLCDISILVVDITHGLQQQTRESLRLLRERKCPFVVALNKVDRLLDWEAHEDMDIEQTLSLQKNHIMSEFDTRVGNVLTQFAEEGFNASLYWKNPDPRKYISVVPTSSRTGEGVCDLLLLMIQLVQRFMEGKVAFKEELQCTVLEVKPIEGFGTTIDVVLVNGTLHEGDRIAVCGLGGPIFTTIRALLTPHPMKEMRVKGDYQHHREIRAAMGIKIAANDLADAVPGTPLFVVGPKDNQEEVGREVMKDLNSLLNNVSRSGVGVAVQSSTLGAMEALLSFLSDMKIPVSAIALGPVHKRHMLPVVGMKDRSIKHAVLLAFDVQVSKDAAEVAQKNNVKIFSANIIYHLFDMFTKYVAEYEAAITERNRAIAIFPAELTQLQGFRNRDPIIVGCVVNRGQLHLGAPLCCLGPAGKVMIGRVVGIEKDKKELKVAKTGEDCAVKIQGAESNSQFGRQFDETSTLVTSITRDSIDALKASFREEMSEDDWRLIIELKGKLGVM